MKLTRVSSLLAAIGALGLLSCSDVPKETPPAEPPKVTKTEPKEPAPFDEPGNSAFLEARKAVLEELGKRGDASVWKLPETSGYATIGVEPKMEGYYEVKFSGQRKDMDVKRDFKVILHQNKITKDWFIDKTNVGGS